MKKINYGMSPMMSAMLQANSYWRQQRKGITREHADKVLRNADGKIGAYLCMTSGALDKYLYDIRKGLKQAGLFRQTIKKEMSTVNENFKLVMKHANAGFTDEAYMEIRYAFTPLSQAYIPFDTLCQNSQVHFNTKFGTRMQKERDGLFMLLLKKNARNASILADLMMADELLLTLQWYNDELDKELAKEFPGCVIPKLYDRRRLDACEHGVRLIIQQLGFTRGGQDTLLQEGRVREVCHSVTEWETSGWYENVLLFERARYIQFTLVWMWIFCHQEGQRFGDDWENWLIGLMDGKASMANLLWSELESIPLPKGDELEDVIDYMDLLPLRDEEDKEYPYQKIFRIKAWAHGSIFGLDHPARQDKWKNTNTRDYD